MNQTKNNKESPKLNTQKKTGQAHQVVDQQRIHSATYGVVPGWQGL